MANTTVNKVVLGDETLIDLTPVTVSADKLASGYTALDASGALITGTLDSVTGSVYQDADGYLVVDEGESTAPQGNVSITANGTYDVAQYAGATVDVVKTYTATISGTGDSTWCYVQVNGTGTKYYTDGDTFTYADGDYLYICYRAIVAGGTWAKLTMNGEVVARVSGTNAKQYYTVHDPRCDMEIEISYGDSTTVNLVVPSTSVASITANGIASIGGSAFANVAVPGMTGTELKKFIERSSSFTDIYWPDGLTTIGSYVFAGLINFNPSSLPSSITIIGNYAFHSCTRLALTELPSGVIRIGSYAFYNCNDLALTELPSGVRSIDNYAFYGCRNMTLTELPSSVTTINANAFRQCVSLTSISCDGVITALGDNAFLGTSAYQMALVSASFPNMALTSNLGTVFGSSTAANACQQLEFCDIGSTIGIAANAFANCYKLQTLVLRKADAVCTLASVLAFTNTPMRGYNDLTGTVYVPQALIESYKTATNWKTLYDAGTVTFAAIEGSEYELE